MKRNSGFTIVELLVVIVVIGILASITIVSYSGITARANTSAGQAAVKSIISKANVYAADGPTGTFPVSYGNLLNSSSATYTIQAASGIDINIQSGNKTLATYRPTWVANDTVDYTVCGVNTSAAATNFATVNVVTGIKLGYWNFSTGAHDITTSAGTVSGTFNSYNVTCYNVGLAEAVMAVARAMYTEGGSTNYPSTVASINANTAVSAKLPSGVVVTRTAANNPIAATTGANNGLQTIRYECYSTGASCAAGTISGARLTYWDYQTSAIATVTLGAVAGGTYYDPAS